MSTSTTNSKQATEAVDIGAQTVAGAYAKALIGAAEKVGVADQVVAELDSWIDDLLAKTPKLDAVFSTGMIAAEEKYRLIDRAAAGKAHPLLVNFLKVLAKNGRLDIVRAVREAAHQVLDELRDRFQVVVTTAGPLSQQQSAALRDRLKGMLGGEPLLKHRLDPDVIGGLVVRVGDHVFDGSLATNLARLREQLIDRSVHEIQRRRDSFSS